jgi:hypothetical protein
MFCAILAGTLCWGGDLHAQKPEDRPEGARRQVRLWDFEDAPDHGEPVPPGWFRAQDNPPLRERPEFPAWNIAILDYQIASSGEFSVRLPTQGGSTSLMLGSGVIAAIPDGDYALTCMVRTQDLTSARVRMAAWFLDQSLAPIPGSRSFSRLAISPGAWTPLELELRGNPEAAWIQIELQLLQPRDQVTHAAPEDEVLPEDFRGAAWFDDVAIYQTPRVNLRTLAPGGIFVAPEEPRLALLVRDLTGEPLVVEMVIYDINGEIAQRRVGPAPAQGRETTFEPELSTFGWYRAVMRVRGDAGLVGERSVDFLWAPTASPMNRETRRGFGIVAERLSNEQRLLLPSILERTQTGSVHLAAWNEQTTAGISQEELVPLAAVVDRLVDGGHEVTFTLARAPEELARQARVDRDDPLPIFMRESDDWQPYLDALLARFGERVRRWQFGPTGSGLPFFKPDLAQQVEVAQSKLRRLVPRPLIELPWRLEQIPTKQLEGVDTLTVWWPTAIPPASIAEYAERWNPSQRVQLTIEQLPESVFGGRAVAVDLARRAACAWKAGHERVAIVAPWRYEEGSELEFQPRPALGAWRTLAEELGGRHIVGELNVGEGIVALIARGVDDSALIAWNDSAPLERAYIRGHLGPGPIVARDLFGNEHVVEMSSKGEHLIELDDAPVFIKGIDVELLQFRAAMRLEPPFIPARAEKHRIELVIENPWPIGITGRLRIAQPEDWTILPRVMSINLPPGGTARLPIDLSFNLGEEAGAFDVVAEVDLRAEQLYPLQRLPLSLEIGLPSVELLPSFRYERVNAQRTDVLVMVRVINLTDKPLTMQAFAQAPGYKSYDAPISELGPGASITRFFRFENGGARLKGRNIRVGLKEQDGTGRLNKTLAID